MASWKEVVQRPGISTLRSFCVDLVHERIDIVPVEMQTLLVKKPLDAVAAHLRLLPHDAPHPFAVITLVLC